MTQDLMAIYLENGARGRNSATRPLVPVSGRRSNSWRSSPGRLRRATFLRDRDAVDGGAFSNRAQTLGIHEVKTAPRSPWQNPYVERLIGTLRRECLDHVVVLNETHLRRLLSAYLIYYHGARTHLSLEKTPRSQDRWRDSTKAESSRRRWSDGAGRCVRLGAPVTPREAKEVHAACPSYQRPITTGRSRSQGTWID
jgi:hypothetical protein